MLDKSDPRRVMQKDIQSLSREAKYLNGLPPDQVLSMLSHGSATHFPQGAIILSEGSPIEEVYVVQHGLAVAGMYKEVDPALWLYVAGPQSVLDPCALLDPPVSVVTVKALTDVEAIAIPRDVFVKIMRQEPSVGFQVLQDLASRLVLINMVALKELGQEHPGPSLN